MPRREIRITGYGGQGVIMTGYIFGKAAAIYDGRHSTMTQSFGPEARGRACAAAAGRGRGVRRLSLPAEDRRADRALAGGLREVRRRAEGRRGSSSTTRIWSSRTPTAAPIAKTFGIPATRIAEELGKRIVQNIVVVGFATAATEIVSKEAAQKAVESSVPEALVDLNLQGVREGI